MPVRSVTSTIRFASLLAITLASGALSACSSGASSSDINATNAPFTAGITSPDTAPVGTAAITSPSPGAILSSDHIFNFVVPSGWNVTPNSKAILDLSSATIANKVAPTIVVTKSSQKPAPALNDVVQMALMQARQEGASVKRLPDRTIGGESAVGFTGENTRNGIDITQTYYMVAHERSLYIVVTTAATRNASSVQETLNAVLSSWSWAKSGDKNSTATGTTPASSTTTASTSPTSTQVSSTQASSTASPTATAASSSAQSTSAPAVSTQSGKTSGH